MSISTCHTYDNIGLLAEPKHTKKKYNIVTKSILYNPSSVEIAYKSQTTLKVDNDLDFTEIDLTEEEALQLAASIKEEEGLVEEEVAFKLPPISYMPFDENDYNNAYNQATTNNISVQQASPFLLNSIPKYNDTVLNQDIVIMDSLIYPNIPTLDGFQIKVLKNFVSKDPCIPHGTNVAEIIAQELDPQKTDMVILNVAIFDCDGSTNIGRIANAVEEIIKYKKGPGRKRGLTVNFSGAGPYSEILNRLFKQLVKNGINVVVAAGNDGLDCEHISPASSSIDSNLQSIGALDSTTQTLARYSNFATQKPCVDLYLPGCLPMTNPWTKQKVKGCGTSFAAPMQAGRIAILKSMHPRIKPWHVKKTMLKNSVTIQGPNDIKLRTITNSMIFEWEKIYSVRRKNRKVNQRPHKILRRRKTRR